MSTEKAGHDCIQGEVLKELRLCTEQHNERFHQGDLQFQEMKQDMRAILKGQTAITNAQVKTNKKLFVDNGTISIQTKIDRHNQLLKGMMWAITSVSLVTASIIGKWILFDLLGKGH